jgi:hypothetical protein
MNGDRKRKTGMGDDKKRGFLATLLMGLVRDLTKFVIAFAVGSGAGAIVCWYYNIPLVFSLLGGILVLGFALAILSDSIFSL